MSQLRIAQVVPPIERVPPVGYGGTERIVDELIRELSRRGHEVTTFASGDSEIAGNHVVTIPRALRPAGLGDDPLPWMVATVRAVLELAARGEFDVIHSHLELMSVPLAAATPVPVIATFHGRMDHPALGRALAGTSARLVAISAHQASARPEMDWTVIHNGLSLDQSPFERRRDDALVFVGRVAPEKGIVEAIEVAQRVGRPLRIAAKIGTLRSEREYHEEIFLPALRAAGEDVTFLGELDGSARDELVAKSYATLMPGAWPEPFGLVAIESLACGTPVIARRVGALPEIVREGVDGFFGDDVQHLASLVERADGLDREAIRASVIDRFSAVRMTDGYETLMHRVAGPRAVTTGDRGPRATQARRRPPILVPLEPPAPIAPVVMGADGPAVARPL